MPFLSKLQVTMTTGSGDRTLTKPLKYHDRLIKTLVVPIGFITNYASIPKVVPRWWLDQDDPMIREPSVIHDWLYSLDCSLDLSRKESDDVLYRAMIELGSYGNWYRKRMNRLKAWSAYQSVRLAGKSHWKQQ